MRPLPRRIAKAAAIAAASGVPLLQALLRAPAVRDGSGQMNLDGSAFTSLAYRMEWGSLSGRDFAHTYGPLAQALTWVAARAHEGRDFVSSLPLVLLAFWTLNVVLAALVVFVVPSLGWKRAALALVLLAHFEIPAHYPSFRALTAMLAVAAAAGAGSAARRPKRAALGVLAAIIGVAAQLLTVEAGLYAVAASAGVLLLAAAAARCRGAAAPEPATRDLEALAIVIGAWLVLQLLAAAALAPAAPTPERFLEYHRGALRTAAGYALAMSRSSDLAAWRATGLAAATLVVLGMAAARGLRSAGFERRLFWGLALLAVAQTKGALTRIDLGHVMLGLTPVVVLWAVQVEERERRWPRAPWWLASGALLLAWPAQGLVWPELLRFLAHPVGFGARWAEARRFRVDEESLLPTGLLKTVRRSRAPVLVVPYQNHLAAFLGRPLVGAVHQAYSAYDVELQRALVEESRSAGPGLDILVVADGATSPPLDGVDTITRVPYVFEELLECCRRPSGIVDRGAFLLERRPYPRVLARRALEVEAAAAGTRTSSPGVAVRFRAPIECPVVALRLHIRYPGWVLLGRPVPLVARLSGRDSFRTERRILPLTAAGEFTTLVALVEPGEMPRLFDDDPPSGPTWDTLEVRPETAAGLGIAPSSLELRAASCLL
jgi:hypothetical protein